MTNIDVWSREVVEMSMFKWMYEHTQRIGVITNEIIHEKTIGGK